MGVSGGRARGTYIDRAGRGRTEHRADRKDEITSKKSSLLCWEHVRATRSAKDGDPYDFY